MSSMTNEDAREFGEHVKHGGWRLGLLVARSVEKGVGNPAVAHASQSRGVKMSASEFARVSGTSTDRVLRYLTGWEKAADQGRVPHASTLAPGQEVTLPDSDVLPWDEFYSATGAGGRPRDSRATDAVTIIERRTVPTVVEAMPDRMRRELWVYLTQMFDADRDRRLAVDLAPPIRDDDDRLTAGRLVMAVAQLDRRVRDVVKLAKSNEVGTIDTDDRDRLHIFITRMREALDLLDTLAGGGVDDAALEAWLAGGAA